MIFSSSCEIMTEEFKPTTVSPDVQQKSVTGDSEGQDQHIRNVESNTPVKCNNILEDSSDGKNDNVQTSDRKIQNDDYDMPEIKAGEKCRDDKPTPTLGTWKFKVQDPTVQPVLVDDANNVIARNIEANADAGFSASDCDVDSVLLAGMRDPRERVALLRLEKVLIDFVKSDYGWLEIGGPYNSTVLAPSGTSNGKQDNPSAPNSMSFASYTTSCTYQSDYTPGQRQTTFQKKVLHRLADRFGIVREQGILVYGAIRLIKLPVSSIPKKLLQDLEPDEYLNNSAVYDSRQKYDSNTPYFRQNGSDQQQINTLSKTFTNTTLAEPKESSVGPASNSNMKSRKMTIMKRSDAAKPTDNNGIENSKKILKKSSSEVSEKEKVYFETRARIFNENAEMLSTGVEGDRRYAAPSVDAFNTGSGNSAESDSKTLCGLQSIPTSKTEPPNDSLPESNFNASASNVLLQRQDSSGPPLQQQLTQTEASQLETKAVYRNRAKEAADPDFRRHRTSAVVAPTPSTISYSLNTVASPTPLHVPAVAYGASQNTAGWIHPSASMYPPSQHQVFNQISQFYPGTRHQQSSQPQHFHYPQHSFSYQQQHPTRYHQYDPHSGMSVKPQKTTGGGFMYKPATSSGTEYNALSTTGSTAAGKTRTVTLKAAAPEFYPPSVLASGISAPRMTPSVGPENSDITTSGQSK